MESRACTCYRYPVTVADLRVLGNMSRMRMMRVLWEKTGTCFLPLFLSCLVSCYEPVSVDLGEGEPVLVVDGAVSTEYLRHEVRLSRSTPYLDTNSSRWGVRGADVQVSDGEHVYVFVEDSSKAGLYRSYEAFAGEPGRTYRLEVWAALDAGEVKQSYSARETMPDAIRMDSITAEYGFGRPPLYSRRRIGWSILLYGTDEPVKNYYGIALYLDGRNYNDSVHSMRMWDDGLGAGLQLDGFPVFMFQTGKDEAVAHAGTGVEMIVRNYTAGYYQYLQDVRALLSPQVPVFSPAPANCRGNVSGGAFGYFAVYSADRKSTVLDARDSIRWREGR